MIKNWFLEKNFTQNERYIIECAVAGGELNILKETEKAVQFKASSDYGNFVFWCPKSCLTENETAEEKQHREEAVNRLENGLKYNEILVNFAKECGIKGMKSANEYLTPPHRKLLVTQNFVCSIIIKN